MGSALGVFADVDQKLSQPRGLLELAAPRYTVYQCFAFFHSERMRPASLGRVTWKDVNPFYLKSLPAVL